MALVPLAELTLSVVRGPEKDVLRPEQAVRQSLAILIVRSSECDGPGELVALSCSLTLPGAFS